MGAFKTWHIIVLVIVVVLLFGAKRLPDMARSLGRSMRILKAETKGLMDDDKKDGPDDLADKADAKNGRAPLQGDVYPPASSQNHATADQHVRDR
ncbi:Sec-independent protein translocase subunit TatA [Catenuloplanes japonicus]|uniref:Sec-independent protein translocase subunit TatA n=1 Tax=Catenuloplanes japonicus TaxID=33876 RepID=UPI00068A69A3|nr:Sec-independent protein translocase subunit TatA [Catenuloplanes japonicus]